MSESIGLECPKCHTNDLVRLENSNTFKCIVCGYSCDLSNSVQPEGKGLFYTALIMLVILGMAIMIG